MPRIPAIIALANGSDVVVDGVATRGVFTHTPTINLIDEDVGQANQVRVVDTVEVADGSRVIYAGKVYEARGTTPSPDTGTTIVHLSEALFDEPADVFPLTRLGNPHVVLEDGRALDAGDAAVLGGWDVATRRGMCVRITLNTATLVSGDLFEWGDVVLSVTLDPDSSSNFVIRDSAGQVATWQQALNTATVRLTLYISATTLRRFGFISSTYTLRNTRSFAATAEGGGTGNPGLADIDIWTNAGLDAAGNPIKNTAVVAATYAESTSLTDTYIASQGNNVNTPPVATMPWAVDFDWLTFAMNGDSVVLLSGKGALANPGTFELINGAEYDEDDDHIDATADSGGTSAARINLTPAAVVALRDAPAIVVGIQINRTGGNGDAVELVRVGGEVNVSLGVNSGNIDYSTRGYSNAGGGVTPNFWHSAVFTDRRYRPSAQQSLRADFRLYLDGATQSSASAGQGGNIAATPLSADLASIYVGGGTGTGSDDDFDRWVRQFTLGIPRAGHTTTGAELREVGEALSSLAHLQRGNLGIV